MPPGWRATVRPASARCRGRGASPGTNPRRTGTAWPSSGWRLRRCRAAGAGLRRLAGPSRVGLVEECGFVAGFVRKALLLDEHAVRVPPDLPAVAFNEHAPDGPHGSVPVVQDPTLDLDSRFGGQNFYDASVFHALIVLRLVPFDKVTVSVLLYGL